MNQMTELLVKMNLDIQNFSPEQVKFLLGVVNNMPPRAQAYFLDSFADAVLEQANQRYEEVRRG